MTSKEATAVILGASGAVGKPLLSLLVSEQSGYSSVYSFARRPHPSPPTVAPGVDFKEVIVDFEKLHSGDADEAKKLSTLTGVKDIFITMGTTRAAAGSMSEFEKIDRGYVLSAAKALIPTATASSTLLYCSSGSSSSSSWFPYLKSKGLTEEGLANLYSNTVILRPGFLQNAQRPQTRLLEKAFEPVMNLAGRFSDAAAAPVESVAKAMLHAAHLGPDEIKSQGMGSTPGPVFKVNEQNRAGIVMVDNKAVLQLARQSS